MTTFDWTTAIAECCTHLASLGNLPPPTAEDSALQAIAVLSLIADTPIRHALTSDSTAPILTVPRYSGRHDLVDDLLAELTVDVTTPARGNFYKAFSLKNWLDEHGIDELIVRSVQHSADDTGRAALLAHTARRASDLTKELHRLRDQHIRQLLGRDIPALDRDTDWHGYEPQLIAWLLAHGHDGKTCRGLRVQRRYQALRLYASLAERLLEPAITEVIDAGHELVPVLMERLTITRSQLAALREAVPPAAIASYRRLNFEHAVRHLQAHAVQLHQWPGGGQPGQSVAWAASPWLTMDDLTLVPANYYGTDPTTVRDAVRAFSDDLLTPLLADLSPPAAGHISPEVILDRLAPEHLPAIQQFLACIHRALIGPRGPKAFQEATHVWHRRAAAVAALRNENQTDRPGWPPLCPPWTSPCGHYQILPLTTAKALVEEGNAHHHCVGTYYDVCRSGCTQILSLRANGVPMVTAEILLDERITSIRVAQFKGLCDEVPDDPALHQAMRDFLRDLRAGKHPLNRDQLRAYRQWADQHYHYGWSSRPLSIPHARQAFPLYLSLLPRGTPATFDQWCDQTGLRAGLHAVVNDFVRQLPKAA
jgi:PcfJ-like protein